MTDPTNCRDEIARRRAQVVEGRLADLERDIGGLPASVARCDEKAAAALDVSRATRDDVRQLRDSLDARFDAIDRAHENAARVAQRIERVAVNGTPTFAVRLRDTLAVIIPVLVALIAAWATVQSTGGSP